MRICHLTSVHPRLDTRIFIKECCSLARAGYDVNLVVADGKGPAVSDGVNIVDVGRPRGRVERVLRTARRVFDKALELDAQIYHLHDPELIPIGLRLKQRGKTVIFDAHEDVPKQVLGKHYMSRPTKAVISKLFAAYEAWACRRMDAVVSATPYLRDKFLAINANSCDVNNFPILGELSDGQGDWSEKQNRNQVCYVGGLSTIRGVREIVKAMALVKRGTRLQLGGAFSEEHLADEVRRDAGWQQVDELGWLGRDGVRNVLNRSFAGLVTLHPVVNYIDALPVKMFEYMSAGIPVIASDFPLWREIIIGNDCGLCVDPTNPKAIAWAIDEIVGNPARAKEMGDNGRRAVVDVYNWGKEEAKLLNLYSKIVDSKDSK